MWRRLTKQQPPYIHDGDPTMIRPVECGRAVVEETSLLFFFPGALVRPFHASMVIRPLI